MITSFAKIITPYTTYPEIASARFINITLATLTLINIYLLTSIFLSPFISFLIASLVASNQINILYGMDITNEVIYGFFLTLSLIVYHYYKKPLIYLLFGILFLLRYESIVIPISVFIIEYYSKKSSLKLKNILLTFIPVFLWLIVLNFHTRIGNSLLGNAYIEEMINGLKNLPNTTAFSALIEIITFNKSYPSFLNHMFSLTTIVLCLYGITNPKTKPIEKIIYLIFGFHLLFIFIFPNFAVRYYVPIIWIMYLVLSNHKSKVISLTVLLCLLSYNIGRIDVPTEYSRPKDMLEYRLTANWLNKYKSERPAIIIIYEPHILKYFVTNKNVYVPFDFETPFSSCKDNIVCICQTLLTNTSSNTDVYVITTAYSSNDAFFTNDRFTPLLHHIGVFDDKSFQNNINFRYYTSVVSNDGDNWANFWQYIPQK